MFIFMTLCGHLLILDQTVEDLTRFATHFERDFCAYLRCYDNSMGGGKNWGPLPFVRKFRKSRRIQSNPKDPCEKNFVRAIFTYHGCQLPFKKSHCNTAWTTAFASPSTTIPWPRWPFQIGRSIHLYQDGSVSTIFGERPWSVEETMIPEHPKLMPLLSLS